MAVKYLFKYIYKGHNHATVKIEKNAQEQTKSINEICLYLDTRYVLTLEVIWRLFYYWLHDRKSDVIQLQVHLSG